jgi:hypothetical protein
LQKEFCPATFMADVLMDFISLLRTPSWPPKTKDSKEVAMYPTDYPFETMPLVINRCKDVVMFFNNNHVPKALL